MAGKLRVDVKAEGEAASSHDIAEGETVGIRLN